MEETKSKETKSIESATEQADFTRLLKENLKRNEEILLAIQDIKKYIHWQKIWAILRFSLIAIPIILGFIYLPPFIKDLVASVRNIYAF